VISLGLRNLLRDVFHLIFFVRNFGITKIEFVNLPLIVLIAFEHFKALFIIHQFSPTIADFLTEPTVVKYHSLTLRHRRFNRAPRISRLAFLTAPTLLVLNVDFLVSTVRLAYDSVIWQAASLFGMSWL
jgi:hypothetical protein